MGTSILTKYCPFQTVALLMRMRKKIQCILSLRKRLINQRRNYKRRMLSIVRFAGYANRCVPSRVLLFMILACILVIIHLDVYFRSWRSVSLHMKRSIVEMQLPLCNESSLYPCMSGCAAHAVLFSALSQ